LNDRSTREFVQVADFEGFNSKTHGAMGEPMGLPWPKEMYGAPPGDFILYNVSDVACRPRLNSHSIWQTWSVAVSAIHW